MSIDPDRSGTEPGSDSLVHALGVLRRRWLILVLAVVIGAALGAAYHQSRTKTYSSTANVAFGISNLSSQALQISSGSGVPERDAATNVLIARSPEVASAVARDLRLTASPGDLLGALSVDAAANANVLDITAKTADPELSARLANAFADQYIDFETRTQIAGIERAQRDLNDQLQALPAGSIQRSDLEASLQRLAQLRAVAGGDAQVIGRAEPSTTPTGLSAKMSIALGAIIGLAIGLTIAFIVESFNRRIASIEEFEREYRLPALTTVPQTGFRRRRADERYDELEPYRILRAALDAAAGDRPLDTILVTSAVPSEGKTTVAVDLAHAIALSGRPVVLVELDLRRPTFRQHFGLDDQRGGVAVSLAHGVSASTFRLEPFDNLPTLSVLPAGALPPNPSELLGSPALQELLTELADGGETTVVIDAPALNPVADAQVLLDNPCIHAVVVVARARKTTRDDARRARAILDVHLLQPLGLVVTGVRDQGQYRYATAAAPAKTPSRRAPVRPSRS